MIAKYLARRGLRLTEFGQGVIDITVLSVVILILWAFVVVVTG